MTDNPLFNSLTEEQKQQYLRWITFRQGKSKVLTELKKKLPQATKSGYSCNMIILDDVIEEQCGQPIFLAPTSDGQDPMQKLLDDYKVWYDKKVAEMTKIPNPTSSLFSATELQAELNRQMFDKKTCKNLGRNY